MGRYDALLQEEGKPAPQSPIENPPPVVEAPALPAQPEPSERRRFPIHKESRPSVETRVRPDVDTDARTPARVKRTITRYAFEFFQDQIETLKKFWLEEQLRGEKGSMSRMVREALDMYISKRERTEE